MKKSFKKFICFLMCILVVFSSVSVVAVAGDNAPYPDGVTAEQALIAVNGTDAFLNSAIPVLTGANLTQLVTPMLYNSQTLSSVIIGLYTSLEERGSELDSIGVDISVSNVANALSAYPDVSATLVKYGSWSEVNLDSAEWGVTDKNGFAAAMGAAFSPLNDVLYMLLCSGTYEVSRFIKIKGADGYNNAIVPMLNSLKCPGVLTQEQFTAEANVNKNNIVKNILLPILTLLEQVLSSPANTLTDSLPSFAYFTESGEMDKCMDALLAPITSNKLVEIAVWLKIIDLELFNVDIKEIFNTLLTDVGEGGLKLEEFDTKALSQCGSHNGSAFVSDKGRAYVVIMRWLVDTLKLNSENLPALLNTMGGTSAAMSDFLNGILSKDTDSIVVTIILLFSPTEIGRAEAMVYPSVTTANVQYTPNLTKENYEKVLNEIDSLLDEFVKEGGSYSTVESLLKSTIYTNNNINSAVVGIYAMFEENGMTDMLKLLGIDASPKGVSAKLTESDYKKAAAVLSKAESWSKVSLNGINWGFYDGSRKGFQNTLTAVLRPLFPVLRVLLAGEDMVIMNSITLKGADGYNTAVIPILEALGCKSSHIKTYSSYKRNADNDGVIKNVLEPVFDLLDDVCEKPVYTLTEILPNIIYFMNSGSLEKCISNLLLPVTAFTDKLSGIYEVKLDTSAITKELDINKLLKGMLEGTGMKIAEFDINTLANLGTPEQRTSKSTINGENTKYTYVKADKTGVLMTLLRVLAKTMKLPGNEDLLMGAMGDTNNPSISMYSDSISKQFETMTEDELIEWLYNLLFKERVQIELVTGEDYKPTIIYKPAEKDYTLLYAFGAYLLVAGAIGLIIYFNRKRLYN